MVELRIGRADQVSLGELMEALILSGATEITRIVRTDSRAEVRYA